jgi:hypothetical protein
MNGTEKSFDAANWVAADADNFTNLEFVFTDLNAAWGTVEIDGFRQYTGEYDYSALECEDGSIAPYGEECAAEVTVTVKKTAGHLLYISFFLMMILVSILL